MPFELIDFGASRSVPQGDALRAVDVGAADVIMIVGGDAVEVARALAGMDVASRCVVLVELGTECLEFHTGRAAADVDNVVGFARFHFGDMPAAHLVELVRLRRTSDAALTAAMAVFKTVGLEVSTCTDVPGRIVDSLLRPYLNAALKSVDEGLAGADDLNHALRLGLGYPLGPIDMIEQGGLVAHHQVSKALYDVLGTPEFFPARCAQIAARRKSVNL